MDVGWIYMYFDLRLQNLKEQDYSSFHNMAVQLIRNYYVVYDVKMWGLRLNLELVFITITECHGPMEYKILLSDKPVNLFLRCDIH